MYVFRESHFHPSQSDRIDLMDRGFTFADGVYEVVLLRKNKPLFLREHVDRLNRNLGELAIAFEVDLEEALLELVGEHSPDSAYALLYLQITRGVAPRQHSFPDNPVQPTVVAHLTPFEPDVRSKSILTVPDIRWLRCDIKTTNLLANVLAAQQAKEAGADEAVFVRDEIVTEGSRTNVAIVRDGTVLTHPLDNYILPGITRSKVMMICQQEGIEIEETTFTEPDLLSCDECFLMGTTIDVTPVVAINGDVLGQPGPITTRLQIHYRELIDSVSS